MYRHPTSDKQMQSPIHQSIWVRSGGVKWIMEEPMANPWWHAGTKLWPLTEAIYWPGPDWWFAESRCHISHPQQWSVLSHNESEGPLPNTEDLPGWFISAELGSIVNKVVSRPDFIGLFCDAFNLYILYKSGQGGSLQDVISHLNHFRAKL